MRRRRLGTAHESRGYRTRRQLPGWRATRMDQDAQPGEIALFLGKAQFLGAESRLLRRIGTLSRGPSPVGSFGMDAGELKQQFREPGLRVVGVDNEQMVVRLVALRGDAQAGHIRAGRHPRW